MPLFGRRQSTSAPLSSFASQGREYAKAAALPESSTDWTDVANIRAEWDDQLEGPEKADLGWRNGTRMYQEGVIPAQKLNVAEYITRGLAYHLFTPVISDADALLAAKRVLALVDEIPAEPAFLAQFAPRLARLALAVIREKGWQPAVLGGDDTVVAEILGARPDGLVVYAARCPGVSSENTWPYFFSIRPSAR